MVFLLKAFFFLYMGLSLRLGEPKPALVGLGLTALVYLVRLPVVMFSLPRSTPDLDRSAVRVLAPKGLAAAALAGLPAAAGLPGGLVIQDVTYAVVLLSVLFSSLAVTWLSRRSSAPKKTSRPAARSSRSSVRIPTSSRKRN
jgi:NhaP-type Na+/H+ or K+/H+ antiporter